jgi:hypothetical protein
VYASVGSIRDSPNGRSASSNACWGTGASDPGGSDPGGSDPGGRASGALSIPVTTKRPSIISTRGGQPKPRRHRLSTRADRNLGGRVSPRSLRLAEVGLRVAPLAVRFG